MTQRPFVGAPDGAIWGFDPTSGLWLPVQVGPVQTGPTGEEYAPLMVRIANANANGQNIMGNSSPVAIASDQSPVPVQLQALYEALLAQSFTATTGNIVTGGAGTSGFCIFNNSKPKTIVIDSVTVYDITVANTGLFAKVTVDPALSTALVPNNDNFNGGASAIAANCTFSSTVFTLPARTPFKSVNLPSNQDTKELLNNGDVIILPANQATGLLGYIITGATNTLGFNIHWWEI